MTAGNWRLYQYGSGALLAEGSETEVWELAAKVWDPVTVEGPLGSRWHLHVAAPTGLLP